MTSGRRVLLNKTAGKIGVERTLRPFRGRVRLVITSPPYPGVHVLYHRWQYRGRKETAAPYVIANVNDGSGGSFYTFGSRTPTGMQNYFATLEASFASIRPLLAPDALVLNYSNPLTRVSLALTRYTKLRIVGLCHGVAMAYSKVGRVIGWITAPENSDEESDEVRARLHELGYMG